jgi:hypothetical protein
LFLSQCHQAILLQDSLHLNLIRSYVMLFSSSRSWVFKLQTVQRKLAGCVIVEDPGEEASSLIYQLACGMIDGDTAEQMC